MSLNIGNNNSKSSRGGLGLIHGDIGLLQDFSGAYALFAKHGDADAGGADTFAPNNPVRLVNRRKNFPPDGFSLDCGLVGNCAQVFERLEDRLSDDSCPAQC